MSAVSAQLNSPPTTPASTTDAMPTAEQHGIKEHSDGRFGYVPVQTRSDRFASVNVADFGPVTGREAVWKLSPVKKFTDLTAGVLDGSEYPVESSRVAGVSVAWVDRTDPRIGSAGAPE
ncbi:Fe-S cluster assembly protein SufD, partial [Cryobacterium sp. Hz7]